MEEDYAFALHILDQLNGVEEFDLTHYHLRAERIGDTADRHGMDAEKIFAVLVDAIRVDIKEHPNQERLKFLLGGGA
ncbi:hypothetical protein H0484_09035 [Pusillimonas sp. CC-YST705]|uniref:Uncharacterized protein n=1 Tax=Mesopusillimonas faecipullorum TaxID=2755040 RepID=A0ABS8CCX1_9BURK|nr:hypothetical protein [Mesopusillimonas faecipullorum]MCB5363891.1 hypothetical protein [Mesopusillimonas faecipullorum]